MTAFATAVVETIDTVTGSGVKPSSVVEWKGSALPSDRTHERLVAEFMANAEATEPARYAAACEKYPVVSESALEAARDREISAFSPSDEAFGDDIAKGSITTAEFISAMATMEAALSAPPR